MAAKIAGGMYISCMFVGDNMRKHQCEKSGFSWLDINFGKLIYLMWHRVYTHESVPKVFICSSSFKFVMCDALTRYYHKTNISLATLHNEYLLYTPIVLACKSIGTNLDIVKPNTLNGTFSAFWWMPLFNTRNNMTSELRPCCFRT